MAYEDYGTDLLRPLVTGWFGKITRAIEAKKRFQEVADECMEFFAGATDFMWKPDYKWKFWKGKLSPRFKMMMNKAFELKALFGPVVFAKYPVRTVTPRQPLDISLDLFGGGMDPAGFQMFQTLQMQEQATMAGDKMRANLMDRWLNYTPREQTGGGLQQQGELAVTEALIKGRGCLWTEPYQPPGSERVITGAWYDSVDNLVIDPDAESIHDAKWIAKRCIHADWQIEDEWNLDRGTLQKATADGMQSAWMQGAIQGSQYGKDFEQMHKSHGKTNDLKVYWKIWSKMGVGHRLSGPTEIPYGKELDELCGDYCFMVVVPGVPYPINMPSEKFQTATPEQIKAAFQWPIPFYGDGRWPVQCLDFYDNPRSPWPIAPLAPGLGELKFINTMVSHLANRIWMSSRDFIALAKSAGTEIKKQIEEGDDLTVIEVEEILGDINNVITWLQQPNTNMDAWKILDAMMEIFDRRVGLSDLLYGLNPGGVQSRTAADINVKRDQISVRPDYMAGKVESWMSEVARCEAMVTRWYVQPKDVVPLLGYAGAYLWQMLVWEQDVDKVIAELEYSVESGSARRPNRERDVANINEALPFMGPVAQELALNGQPRILNALWKAWGRATDQDVSEFMIPEPPPMPPMMPPPGPMPGEPPPPDGAMPPDPAAAPPVGPPPMPGPPMPGPMPGPMMPPGPMPAVPPGTLPPMPPGMGSAMPPAPMPQVVPLPPQMPQMEQLVDQLSNVVDRLTMIEQAQMADQQSSKQTVVNQLADGSWLAQTIGQDGQVIRETRMAPKPDGSYLAQTT